MKETRDQEVAPYVVVYFDVPQGEHIIYMVVKNVGKSVATNVRIEIDPKLIGSREKDFSTVSLIRDGIASIPPGYEIRTFVDTGRSMFDEQNKRPLTYRAKVTYFGGLKDIMRTTEQILDLSVYKGLSFVSRRGIHDLAQEVEKISESIERISKKLSEISDKVSEGIYIRNPVISFSVLSTDFNAWKASTIAKLMEFKHLWSSVYNGNHDKLYGAFLGNFKMQLKYIDEQLLVITANSPPMINSEIKDSLLKASNLLIETSSIEFYAYGDMSEVNFDAKGKELDGLVDSTIAMIEKIYIQ
jgi:hypothetical protein